MHKVIKSTKIGISEQDAVWSEIADLIEANDQMAGTYHQEFQRTPIQEKLRDIIYHSEVPDDRLVHILMYGSVGSGKTTGALAEVTEVMVDYPGAEVLGVRRTFDEIERALYKPAYDFLDKFEIPHTKSKGRSTIYFNNGSIFRMTSAESTAKSKSDKADNLGGTQYCAAIMDEADNIPEEFARTVSGRMRQNIGVKRRFIIYICNPPSKDHWLYRFFFEHADPDNQGVTYDPNDPKSPYRVLYMHVSENLEHLPPGYMDDIHRDYADNPMAFKRMVDGHFGPAVKGYPIFNKHFSKSMHVSDKPIWKNWKPHMKMQRGWDFGFRRPALVVGQDDTNLGQFRIFRCILGYQELLDSFAERHLQQLHNDFPDADWEDFCDPAGTNHYSDVTHKTSFDVLKEMGLRPKKANNDQTYGFTIIRQQLARTRPSMQGPIPAVLIDPSCEIIIDAFEFGTCSEKAKQDGGTYSEDSKSPIKQVKDGFYEHVMDAYRYIMVCKRKKLTDEGVRNSDRRNEWRQADADGTINTVPVNYVSIRSKKYGGTYGFNKRRDHH